MTFKLENIKEYIILTAVFLFPILFADNFIDKTGLPKLIMLGSFIFLSFIAIAIEVYVNGKLKFGKGKFDLPVILLVASYVISALLVTPNKAEAFFLPGTATFVLEFGLLYFLLNMIEDKNKIKYSLLASSVVLSLTTILSFLGVFDKIGSFPAFMKQGFNPAGDYLTGSIFLVATTTLCAYYVVKESDITKKLVFAFSLIFILIATGISIFTLVSPDSKTAPALPPVQTSWAVTIDTIRENPILGMGPGNYLTAFNRFRPATYNLTKLWQLRFATSRDWYLTVGAETGLLGLISVIILIIAISKITNRNLEIYKKSKSVVVDTVPFAILVGLVLALALLPSTPVTIFLLFVLLSINSQSHISEINLGSDNQTFRLLIALVVAGLVVYVGFKSKPIIQAEAVFKEANDALVKNDGKKTYELLQKAITLNPYEDRYHASYSQINLAIARSIASNAKDPKNLSDNDKSTISQLIQQAIKEGQNTVALNPTRAANWQVLANIYQIIIPYANQADQFAIQSYQQTINLDPVDPNLRIALGGIYYSLGQYDNAVNSFQFAALAKPDLANAYYNLAAAFAAKSDFANAIASMNTVLSLVPKDSQDAKTAKADLDALTKKQKSLQEATSSGTLTTPQKQEKPAISPQLNLPSEASPPAAPNLPTPTPSVTSSPSASPK